MSWDVSILKEKHVEGSEAGPPPLGDAQEVRNLISSALPAVDWSDPAWGTLQGDGWSIEFNTAAEGTVGSLMLHVRGGGDPLPTISKLCATAGWVALDMSTGDYIDLVASSGASWREFQGFRDSIAAASSPAKKRSIAIYIIALLLAMLILVLTRWL